jgi:hypothetical protein
MTSRCGLFRPHNSLYFFQVSSCIWTPPWRTLQMMNTFYPCLSILFCTNCISINLLKPCGFFLYHQPQHSKILHGARFALSVLYGSQNKQRPLLYHHHHLSVMDLGHLLTRSGLMYPEASSKVCHGSFCQLGCNLCFISH